MPFFGLPAYWLKEALRRSRSIAIIRLPLMPKLVARLKEIKVFPLPGLAEVIMMTWDSLPLFCMNSKLVRTTRNASLMTLRLFSLTTTAHSFSCVCRENFFFLRKSSGISPTNGIVRFSKSLRPRTTVFMFSFIKMITTGISIPRANATSRIFFLTGAVGIMLPPGLVIMRVL